MSAILTLEKPANAKTWVAEVGGRDETYGVARKFLAPISKDGAFRKYELHEGKLYQIHTKDSKRRYIKVDGDEIVDIVLDDVLAALNRLDSGRPAFRCAESEALDQALERGLARINAEGSLISNPSEN